MRRALLPLVLLSVTLLTGLAAPGGVARAQENSSENTDLATAVAQVASDVAAYLKGTAGMQDCSLGTFVTVPPGGVASPQIKDLLAKELKRLEIQVKRRSPFSCTGKFVFVEAARKVRIEVDIDRAGSPLKTCTAEIFRVTDLAVLLGGTGQLSVNAAEREESFTSTIIEPQGDVATSPPLTAAPAKPATTAPTPRSVAKASKTGLFGLEILVVGADGSLTPVEVEEEKGFLYVSLQVGQTYAIRLLNPTPHLAAATVTIDGLNLFAFSENEGYRKLGKMLVLPGEQGSVVKGWHKSNAEVYSFRVAGVEQAAVRELQDQEEFPVATIDDSTGIITATFSFAIDLNRSKANPNDPLGQFPKDEPKSLSVATEKGPLVEQKFTEIEARYGQDREIISIRYDRVP